MARLDSFSILLTCSKSSWVRQVGGSKISKSLKQSGVGKCPMTWEYWTSPYSSHLVDHIPNGWVMWKIGTFNDPWQCQPMLATCQKSSTSFIDMLSLLTIHVALAQCLHVSPAAACSHISHCLMTSISPASQVIRFKQAHVLGIPIYHHLSVVKGVNNPPINQPTNGKSTGQNYKPLQGPRTHVLHCKRSKT